MIPTTVVATPAEAAAPVAPEAPREYALVLYGLMVAVAGFVAILIALVVVVANSNPTSTTKGLADPAAFLGMVAIAIAAICGACVGATLGLQGVISANRERAAAEAAREAVQIRAERYLAYLEPEIAKNLVQ
jgi:hypothetical protein